ncbi:MAG: hypothetical protein ABIQ36_10460 [Rhodanobacter sp.]
MNSPANAILIATFAATIQLTAPTSHAQEALRISCAAPHLPSQQAVAKALDLHNFGQVYHARNLLMSHVHRACGKGATQVLVSSDSPAIHLLDGSCAGPRMGRAANRPAASEPR